MMAKKSPAGQTSTGPARENSRNPGSKGTVPEPIERFELGDEGSGPLGGRRSGSTGAESMSQLDAERVPFEEPERRDSVREVGPVEEG